MKVLKRRLPRLGWCSNKSAVARHTETEEIVAVYIPLYVIPEHRGLRLQVRPLDMFMENVEVNGQEMPRLRYIGPEL